MHDFSLTSTRQKIVLFILLSLATLGSDRFIDQYTDIGKQLLANADFSAGLNQWHSSGPVGSVITIIDQGVSLRSSATDTNVSIYQKITAPMGGKMVRLRALVQTKNVVAGEKSWNMARLLLVQYVNGKSRWHLPHAVIALEGTSGWQEVSSAFTIASDSVEIRVVVQMSRCSGEFFLKDIALYEVEETVLYGWLKWLVRGSWILFIVFLFVPYLRSGKVVVSALAMLITVAAILIGTTMPASVKDELKGKIEAELAGEILELPVARSSIKNESLKSGWLRTAVQEIDMTKVAHFVLFALLVVLIRHRNPDRSGKLLLLDIFMLACATELNQMFIVDRSPLFSDVLIDMAGAGVGLLLVEGRQKMLNSVLSP